MTCPDSGILSNIATKSFSGVKNRPGVWSLMLGNSFYLT